MKNYLKSITAFVIAFAGALSVANNDNHITGNEWLNSLIVGVISLGTVWGIPNVKVPSAGVNQKPPSGD